MAHISKDGENDATAKDRGECVDSGNVCAVTDEISVVLVVRPQRRHPAESAAEGVEDLSPSVNPDLSVIKKETGKERKKRDVNNLRYRLSFNISAQSIRPGSNGLAPRTWRT